MMSRWVRGQFSEPFITTVLPQASGTQMARVPRMTGAFHAAMPSTTPAGWRTAMASGPGMSVEQIAVALNCSKRHLYNAFAEEDQTLASYIQGLRLDACVRELQHPMAQTRPITDIALSWGFNSPSHFSRVFREHTGKSPSEFRAASPT